MIRYLCIGSALAMLLVMCGDAGQDPKSDPVMEDMGSVSLNKEDLTVYWTIRSSEGQVAAEGSCAPIPLSYDRSLRDMRSIASALSIEFMGTDCTCNSKEKDQFLYGYLFNAAAAGQMAGAQVTHYGGGANIEVGITMNEQFITTEGTLSVEGNVATVELEVPLSELQLAPYMTEMVNAWSRRTGEKKGLSELVEVRIVAEFKPHGLGA